MILAERPATTARARGWIGAAIDALVVQALRFHARGDGAGALTALDAVFEHAEPEGYVRIFLDEGPAMGRLLKAAAKRPNPSSYIQMLARLASPDAGRTTVQHGLVEPLSERELGRAAAAE